MEKQSTTSAPSLKQEAGPPSKPIPNPSGNYGEGRKALIDKSLIPPQNETYPGRDSNPYALRHQIESLTRIPIPPPGLAASPPCSNKVGEVLFEDSTEPQSGQSSQTDSDVNGNFNKPWKFSNRLKWAWSEIQRVRCRVTPLVRVGPGQLNSVGARIFWRFVALSRDAKPVKQDFLFIGWGFGLLSKRGRSIHRGTTLSSLMWEDKFPDSSSTIPAMSSGLKSIRNVSSNLVTPSKAKKGI